MALKITLVICLTIIVMYGLTLWFGYKMKGGDK